MRNENNKVDFQDYNEQVLQFITIPNIILNTVVAPTNATEAGQEEAIQTEGEARTEEEVDQEEANEDEDEEDDYEDEPEADEEELDHADAELEISEQQAPDILKKVSNRSQCFMGEWQSLPVRKIIHC
jgi:protein-histidine N-methyltransferase